MQQKNKSIQRDKKGRRKLFENLLIFPGRREGPVIDGTRKGRRR